MKMQDIVENLLEEQNIVGDIYVPRYDLYGFKQRVADEMGLDLSRNPNAITCSKFALRCDGNAYLTVGYRIDLRIGKYHACGATTVLSMAKARYIAHGFNALVRKWYDEKLAGKTAMVYDGSEVSNA